MHKCCGIDSWLCYFRLRRRYIWSSLPWEGPENTPIIASDLLHSRPMMMIFSSFNKIIGFHMVTVQEGVHDVPFGAI